jgi:hypothetical protein
LATTSLLLSLLLASQWASAADGAISGVAVNGTSGGTPLAGATVVLRASYEGAFVAVSETTTDVAGRFSFEGLPLDANTIYLAGVNHAGVHYPGERVRLEPARPSANANLVAYDAIEGPSPLSCERHEIWVRPQAGYLQVSEALVVANRSLSAFVGPSDSADGAETLRLSLPPGFDKVTFDKEFHGRNFEIHDGTLATRLPWPPGNRELKFSYRLPVEQRHSNYARRLDLPTDQMWVRLAGVDPKTVACTLASVSTNKQDEAHFSNHGKPLPAGTLIELRQSAAPMRFEAYARWAAVAMLATMICGCVVAVYRGRTQPPANLQNGKHDGRRTTVRRNRRSQVGIIASRPKR